jgi:hypothetical protein
MNSTIKAASKFVEELNQSNENGDTNKDGIQHIKSKFGGGLKKLESSVMHGQYIRSMDIQLISAEETLL